MNESNVKGSVRGQKVGRRGCRFRRGTTAVEFATVSPLIFLFVFASVEFGRAMMAIETMEGAAHDGCRVAIVKGASVKEVEAAVLAVMSPAGITQFQTVITPSSLANIEQWAPVSVSVTASFGDITWLPVPKYIGNITLSGGATLPREAENDR
jgi:Flp pilus assembly protein TadG